MTSRVFIPQYPMHWRNDGRPPAPKVDLTPAMHFGKLVTLLPGRPELDPDKVMPLLRAGLRTFNSDTDYLIAVGHPILIMWTGAVLAQYVRQARFLDWVQDQRVYKTVTLTMKDRTHV